MVTLAILQEIFRFFVWVIIFFRDFKYAVGQPLGFFTKFSGFRQVSPRPQVPFEQVARNSFVYGWSPLLVFLLKFGVYAQPRIFFESFRFRCTFF